MPTIGASLPQRPAQRSDDGRAILRSVSGSAERCAGIVNRTRPWVRPTDTARAPNQRRVDTHLDVHVAAALDERGAQLGVESFAATAAGYQELLSGSRASGPSSSSASKGPAAMGRDSPVTSWATRSPSSKWTDPTAGAAGARESPIPTTLSARLDLVCLPTFHIRCEPNSQVLLRCRRQACRREVDRGSEYHLTIRRGGLI